MLFLWRLSPRGDGVKECSPSQQPRAPADVADSYGAQAARPGRSWRGSAVAITAGEIIKGPRCRRLPCTRLCSSTRKRALLPIPSGGRATQLGTRRGLRFDRRGCCRADPGPQRRAARGITSHPPGRHAQPRPGQLLVGVDRRWLPSPQRDR